MKQIHELWPERLQAFQEEMRRYLKYMFNDHIKFVLIFGGGAAIYYYSQWVNDLPPDFPAALVMTVVLAFLLTAGPIITLVKEADKVFLIPLEDELKDYFKKGLRLSFIIQAYVLLLVSAAFMPMYNRVEGAGFMSFVFLFAVLLLLKYWNLALRWDILKTNDSPTLTADLFMRYLLNAGLLYLLISRASWWFILAVMLIMAAFTVYTRQSMKKKTLKWERLIEKEQGRMLKFYRMANLFTDVPHLGSKVWRRKWMDPIFMSIPFAEKSTFRFLYARTIVRTSEYSGLILRLTAMACLILYFVDHLYAAIGISWLFLYLTGFQLLPLIRRYDLKIWIHLYPVPADIKKRDFYRLLIRILGIQALLFGVITAVSGNLFNALLVLAASLLFAIVFGKQYVPGRVKKMEPY
ncbi:ABC transporter permease [Siminovitchia sediminis]|uniref:ABC transporter permease n=1 Tax=Siminovitchia sediminis TaxID=1274353 RepID=A0ABW4KM69_9BACI